MNNKGFYEPSLTPIAPLKRPFEEVFQKLERYETALKEIADNDEGIAGKIAEEALDA